MSSNLFSVQITFSPWGITIPVESQAHAERIIELLCIKCQPEINHEFDPMHEQHSVTILIQHPEYIRYEKCGP